MASDINVVVVTGNLTRDMELSYLQSGTAVGKFGIAVNRSVKNGEQWVDDVSFFDVTLFGKSAEALKQYLAKGKPITLVGSLRQDRWKDKTGKTCTSVHIIAEHVRLGGSGNGQQDGGEFPEDVPF